MRYVCTYLIPQNIASDEATAIVAVNSAGREVASASLGKLARPDGDRQCRALITADIHRTRETANDDHQRALIYGEQYCDFIVEAGDLVEQGSIESQMADWKDDRDTYAPTTPVYVIPGNHEHFKDYADRHWEQYTGYPLYYTVTSQPDDEAARNYYNPVVGDDVFIMVGHYGSYGDSGWLASESWSLDEMQWLYETLEANRNKRCFVFTHVFPHEHGVGNPNNLYVKSGKPLLWYTQDGGIGQAFISLLRHYKNVTLFTAHNHIRTWLQKLDKKCNYSDADGYRHINIPSLSVPREPSVDGTTLVDVYDASEGIVLDMYDGYIICEARDFVLGQPIPIGTYCIPTPIVEVEAGTFVDPTGTITTT